MNNLSPLWCKQVWNSSINNWGTRVSITMVIPNNWHWFRSHNKNSSPFPARGIAKISASKYRKRRFSLRNSGLWLNAIEKSSILCPTLSMIPVESLRTKPNAVWTNWQISSKKFSKEGHQHHWLNKEL